jgi:hypothetical protein
MKHPGSAPVFHIAVAFVGPRFAGTTVGCGSGKPRLNAGGSTFVYPMMSQWAAEYDKDKRVEVTPLAADVHFHLRRQPLRRLAPPGMGGRFGPTGGRHAAEFRRPAGDRETGSASEPGRLTWTPAKHVSEWRNLMRQPRMPAKVVQIEAAR